MDFRDLGRSTWNTAGVGAAELRERLTREHGVVVATGQGAYRQTILRIAHMGFCTPDDIEVVLEALRDVLRR